MATTVTSRPQPGAARPEPPGTLDAPVQARKPREGLAPWAVVAIWGSLLGILAAMGAGFGNSAFILEVSGSAAGFVLLLAGAVWLDRRLRPRREYLRQPTRTGGVFMFVVAVTLAWLSLAFGLWIAYLTVVPLIAAGGLEISARRHARNARVASIAGPGIPPAGSGAAPGRTANGGRSTAPELEPSGER